ncbi:hypothetical protein BESB_062840 [Besnoitia besnoiti]|uniref:Uncharacterized protein n=1 Tax=Besnoitia besnoiti TaxID=94643 RepID=A0A2A9MII7_BESBE|nr:hypothetical protein BESB_062840 [Besnoitia besnoiti]PFH35397.1 hypothetical protein BESB_062840 [Besnoitia besnoiti]
MPELTFFRSLRRQKAPEVALRNSEFADAGGETRGGASRRDCMNGQLTQQAEPDFSTQEVAASATEEGGAAPDGRIVEAIRKEIDEVRLCHGRIPEISVRREQGIVTSSLSYPTLRPFRPWCCARDNGSPEAEAGDLGFPHSAGEAAVAPTGWRESAAEYLSAEVARLLGEAVAAAAKTVPTARLQYRPRTHACPHEEGEMRTSPPHVRPSSSEQARLAPSQHHLDQRGPEDGCGAACSVNIGSTGPQGSACGELRCPLLPEGAEADKHRPILILLGGPSGTGKSTLAPLLVHLLMARSRRGAGPPAQAQAAADGEPAPLKNAADGRGVAQNTIGWEDGCVVVSSDHTRKVLRVLSQSHNALLFSSTYELQTVVRNQLAGLRATPKGREKDSTGSHSTDAGEESSALAGDRAEPRTDAKSQAEDIARMRMEVEQNLGPFSAWFPERCPSCQELYPCSAVLGLLLQSVLLQQKTIGTTIDCLMQSGTTQASDPGGKERADQTPKEECLKDTKDAAAPLRLVVVEGVHLSPAFVRLLQARYGRRCLSFTMYVPCREQHSARLQSRKDDSCQPAVSSNGTEPPESHVPAACEVRSRHEPDCVSRVGGRATPLSGPRPQSNNSQPDSAVEEPRRLPCAVGGQEGSQMPSVRSSDQHGEARTESLQGRHAGVTHRENKYLRNLCNIRCLQIYLCLAAQSCAAGAPPEAVKQQAIEAACIRFASEAEPVSGPRIEDRMRDGGVRLADLARRRSWGNNGTYTVLNRDVRSSLEFICRAIESQGLHAY